MFKVAKGENSLRYKVVITEDEDGEFVAECPSLPGCISQGKTREAAIENIQDATTAYRLIASSRCQVTKKSPRAQYALIGGMACEQVEFLYYPTFFHILAFVG